MTLSKKQQAHYAAMAARAENEDYSPIEHAAKLATERSTTLDELDELVEGIYDLPTSSTPPGVTGGRATEEDLQELIALGGRPGLSGRAGSGPSPKRQVRLPRELDDLLTQRAARDHLRPSQIMRDAIDAYLRAG
ncbi:hypothetical protein [Microbacterium sp. T32]|uniref:hypothetical protein n=1 Tax=Microbacterium sp. T32 TaxID=1776083 RepID=UPI0007ABA0EF|nr:hypothetical protein [Microbacterium sp. T32]KZE39556.1 hypothetical protein AVW09_04395 [Microbacterium sp. T32]